MYCAFRFFSLELKINQTTVLLQLDEAHVHFFYKKSDNILF